MQIDEYFYPDGSQALFLHFSDSNDVSKKLIQSWFVPISISLTWTWKAKRPLYLGKDNSNAFQQATH